MSTSLKAVTAEALLGVRARLNNMVDARWDNYPFGREPRAGREEYLAWYEEARRQEFPAVDAVEAETGFAIDRAWINELALHTQVVKKESELAWPHGRLLYSLLRQRIDAGGDHFTVLETGTARGFSALCMAKALADAGVRGRVVTLDVLPHLRRQIWNCIDDHEAHKSRAELLAPWSDLTRDILFLQGDTQLLLPKVGLDRIHFAFLDAQHIKSSVLHEFEVVAARQQAGDIIFFDDVTAAVFPGVVEAVDEIERAGAYSVRRLAIAERRAYAWGVKR